MKVLAFLLLFAPAAIIAEHMRAQPVLIFALSALAIIPLSGFLGKATEELSTFTGPTLGGLMNATLGNLAEDRPGDGRLDEVHQARAQRQDGDDQLGEIPERCVHQATERRAGEGR